PPSLTLPHKGGGNGSSAARQKCETSRPLLMQRLAMVLLILVAGAVLAPLSGAHAQQFLEMSAGKRTRSVVVPSGKSENIHTDANFAEIVVGDPDIADVIPLTDHSLSVLGKKIGTTRVSV